MKDGEENGLLAAMIADCVDGERLRVLAHGLRVFGADVPPEGERYYPVKVYSSGYEVEVEVRIKPKEVDDVES